MSVLIASCCAMLGVLACPASAAPVTASCVMTTGQPVTVAGFQVSGCATVVSRDLGGPLYILSGTISLGGVSVSPTGADTRYTRESVANCAGPCADAVARFWSADDGPEILVDPTAVRIESNHPYALSVSVGGRTLTLYGGRIHVAAPADPRKLIDLDVGHFAALLGLPIKGRFQLSTDSTSVRLHLNLGLPTALGGATGETDVSVAADGSVMLNQLSLSVGFVRLGGVDVTGLAFVYDAASSSWQGTAMLRLPAPSAYQLEITLTVQNGAFKSIAGSVSNLNVSLGYGVFLQKIAATFGLNPVTLGGMIGLSAGPQVVRITALSIDGGLRIVFPGRQNGKSVPFTRIEATGALGIVGQRFADGRLAVQTNGLVEAGARVGASGSVGSFSAAVAGAASPERFNLEGRADVRVKFGVTFRAGGRAIVSSKGIAACADFGGWFEAGVGRRWDRSFASLDGCDLGPFRVSVKREPLAPGATGTFTIPAFLPEAAVNVSAVAGAVAPPRFVLVDPNGQRVTEPAGAGTITSNVAVVQQTEDDSTTVVLRQPRAGRWRLEPVAGSPAIASIDVADGLRPARATARVTGLGPVRTLHWTLRTEPGQSVAFVEHGAADSKVITTTDRPSGSVSFDVPPGLGGDRQITAEFEEADLPRADQVVAHYTAPDPPRPAKPRITSTSRVDISADIRWQQPDGSPDHYVVTTQSSDGEARGVELPGSARRYKFTTDRKSDRISVTVTAVNAYDIAGPTLAFRYVRL